MMKATGLKRGSRKKQQQQQQQVQQQPQLEPQGDVAAEKRRTQPTEEGVIPRVPAVEQAPEPTRRSKAEPTAGELALTSKNYRLAKELSELRVRYREESKNVTRLTMENMNLASRCREAISHVAMLKKELAMHQKRAAESLAMQREQTQRMASNLSAEVSKLSTSYSEDSADRSREIERAIAAISPPAPPPQRQASSPKDPDVTPNGKDLSPPKSESPRGEFYSDVEQTSTAADTASLRVSETLSTISPSKEEEEEAAGTTSSPRVYSTPKRNRTTDRWTPRMDGPTTENDESEAPGMFPHSASPKVVSPSGQRNYNEEFPSDIIPQPHRSKPSITTTIPDPEEEDSSSSSRSSPSTHSLSSHHTIPREGVVGMNNIDAFEASFDTNFPPAFNAADEDPTMVDSTAEIYNPFAPSPARSTEYRPGYTPTRDSAGVEQEESTSESSPEILRTTNASDSAPFGTPTSPIQKRGNDRPWNVDLRFQTPPRDKGSPENELGEPSRPHKTMPAEARARYEKALQPRQNGTTNGETKQTAPVESNEPVQHKLTKGSPSALLKRIQQRRMNKMSRQQSTPESVKSSTLENSEAKPDMIARHKSAPEASTQNNSRSPAEVVSRETTNVVPERGLPSERPGSERPFDEEELPKGVPSSETESSYKNRRSVKQPISYAEPALNTKLRAGDTFFPKGGIGEPMAPQIVTPEPIPHASPTVI